MAGVRTAFASFTSPLDFCRKVDRHLVSRHDLILPLKLGAFGFTGLSRAQPTVTDQYYAAAADVMRVGDTIRLVCVRSRKIWGRAQ